MQIDTTRFGRIEIAENAVIHFPRPLYGLDAAGSYCLLAYDEAGCFHWLQATDAPTIAMVVTDPFRFFPDYQLEIPDPAADLLQASAASDIAVYTLLTIAAEERRVYTNLLGPIAVNCQAQVGLQLIQNESRYTTRHPLPVDRQQATVDRTEPSPSSRRLSLVAR
jgi:flagellar assembly factor FliW